MPPRFLPLALWLSLMVYANSPMWAFSIGIVSLMIFFYTSSSLLPTDVFLNWSLPTASYYPHLAVFTISPQMLTWHCLTSNCISPPPVPRFDCNLCASMTLHALVVSKTLLTMCSSQSTHGEKPTCQCRRWGFDPYVGKSLQGRSPGGGNGNALQASCLGNAMDRRNLEASIHGIPKESDTT